MLGQNAQKILSKDLRLKDVSIVDRKPVFSRRNLDDQLDTCWDSEESFNAPAMIDLPKEILRKKSECKVLEKENASLVEAL